MAQVVPKVHYKDDLDNIIPVAERQEGYFSAVQASEQGISHLALSRMVEAGHIERALWGVYRLTRWPASRHGDLWPIALWGQKKEWPVVFSHRTALQLHAVSDINPSRIDITLPRQARFRGKLPRAVSIHQRDVPVQQIDHIDGLSVTNLYRTLLDLLVDGLARDSAERVLLGEERPKQLSKRELAELRALYEIGHDVRQFLAINLPHVKIKGPVPK